MNQLVAHEIIALELLTVLLENPTDSSVEVAVGFVTECGSLLQDLSPKGLHGGYAVGIELLSCMCLILYVFIRVYAIMNNFFFFLLASSAFLSHNNCLKIFFWHLYCPFTLFM